MGVSDSPENIARDYIRHLEAGFPVDGDWSAWESVEHLVRHDPARAWLVVQELVRQASDDRQLSDIAAGPLEDLLVQQGAAVITAVEQEYASNERFRKCLWGVWGRSIAEPVWRRLEALCRAE